MAGGELRSGTPGRDQTQKTRAGENARVTRSRLRGRAPVRDQSVIAKIKETMANGAERRPEYICIYIYICSG